jgi:hypothetical protein
LDVALEFDQPVDTFDGKGMSARYSFDSRNWNGNLKYDRLTEGFRADSGFESRVGGDKQEVSVGRTWHGEEESWWTRIRLRTEYEVGHLDDGTLIEKEVSMRLGVGGPMQSWTQIMLRTGSELEEGVLFDVNSIGIYTNLTPRSGLTLEFYAQAADQIDYANTRNGKQLYIQPAVIWNVNRNLLMRVQGVLASLETEEGEKIFDASVFDVRLTWQFNIRSFLRLTVQHSATSRNLSVYDEPDDYDAESRNVGRQLLYSYKINPQTVFYLGYSDQYVDHDQLDDLAASDRTLFLKIGYAWNL